MNITHQFCAGIVILSPNMSVAPVCRIGDPLHLTCTTSVEFLEWHMRVINEQGRLHEITAFSNSRDVARQLTLMVVNDTSFTFMRTSARNDTPLVSTLAINSTSIGLNGTVVRCRDANNPITSASTTLQIFDVHNTCELNYDQFGHTYNYNKIIILYDY